MADILTLGELLIDLTQNGTDELGNGQFTAYPGGAPANVAVAAARLGADTGFIGKVGDDSFGRSLAETLRKEGVNTDGLF
ncbi:MAG: carbohydrate kinase, partial [Mogibacterium sp.]|nr:carbohydrate kinase [Mogibacterium sp.]